MPRQTADVIALILAVALAFVVCLTAVALSYVAISEPTTDVTRLADGLGRIINVLVAALVGYMAGRVIKNGNGH